jgi:hypothetical protein
MRSFWYALVCAVLLVARTSQLPAEEWTDQRDFGRFQLRANFPLSGHDALVDELGQLDRDIQQQLARQPTSTPVHLLLFADLKSYTRYLNRYFAGVPIRRAMFIQGSAPGWVFAYQNKDYEVDLRHETTHALLHSQIPSIPLWLDEGLAEYYEVASNRRVYLHPHLSKVRWDARFFRPPSLESLESLTDIQKMGTAEYRMAWAWVHFMLHGPPAARQILIQYLDELESNPSPDPLGPRLRAAIPDLETEYRRHFRNWRQ